MKHLIILAGLSVHFDTTRDYLKFIAGCLAIFAVALLICFLWLKSKIKK